MSSNDKQILGPRNAGAAERGAYQARDFFRGEDVALMTAGLAIVIAGEGKAILKTETVGMGSVKKALQSFAVVAAAGIAAHHIKNNMSR